MRANLITVLGFSLLVLGGCSEKASGPAAVSTPSRFAAAPQDAARASQELAHALAIAMARPEVRVHVRNAMRASLVNEHKLVLQDFVRTTPGRHLVEAAAAGTGRRPEDMTALIASLPEMDFYVPFREHRMWWKGTADVVVGAILDTRAQSLTAFRPDGSSVLLSDHRRAPLEALLLVHPAESKGRRIHPQRRLDGDVIQDPDDGELAGSFSWRDRAGRVRNIDFADLKPGRVGAEYMEPCAECSGGGGTTEPADTTYNNFLQVNYVDYWGSSEINIYAKYMMGSTEHESGKIRYLGVESNKEYTEKRPLLFRELPADNSAYIEINVVETDALFDDDKGSRKFYHPDLNEKRSVISGSSVTNLRLTWTP